ncbi:MAG: hypothetical protein ACOH2T_19045 [Pseudomonas sp.]
MSIVGVQKDKLIVALTMDEATRSINAALRIRKASFKIHFKNKLAICSLGMPGVPHEPIAIANPSNKHTVGFYGQHPDLLACLNDIRGRLATHDARLHFVAEKPKNKKAVAKLQVFVDGSRTIVLTLMDAIAGTSKIDHEFITPDGRTL